MTKLAAVKVGGSSSDATSRTWITVPALPNRPTSLLFAAIVLVTFVLSKDAAAELGPCTSAAPTTPDVVVFVSDIERSMRWYQESVGLAKIAEPSLSERGPGIRAIVMARNGVGVTLVSSLGFVPRNGDLQMVCFPLNGHPAPSAGFKSVFLVDPDGTSVELPASPGF